ncbi:MAG: hypothetical protein RBR66_03385 [Candidatus Izemoplasmatales bacterium]|nr:hypothetical protein [Candidatus Izemoplasmatales bacterium]
MKKLKFMQIFLMLFAILFTFNSVKAVEPINIHFFFDPSCLHCAEEKEWLESFNEDNPDIQIIVYDLSIQDNYELFVEVKTLFNDRDALSPYTVVGGIALRGFNEQTKSDIENIIERYRNEEFSDIVAKVINNESITNADFDEIIRDTVNLPFIGEVETKGFSLLLGAIIIGFVDGFNPCALWVLILLISLLINSNNKKRMWYLGLIFLVTSALVYFLIMMSYLTIAIQFTTITVFRYLIAALAVGFGGYNLYKFIKTLNTDDGCEVVSDKKRIKIIERIKKIVREDHILIAIIGIIALALIVNLIELACSAGLPLLYTSILAFNEVSSLQYFLYVLVYVLFFLIDDIIIFTIALFTMKITGITNRYTKYSHLISGLIMVVIGVLLAFFPNIIMFN